MSITRVTALAGAFVLIAAVVAPAHGAPAGAAGVDLELSVAGPSTVPATQTTFPVTFTATNLGPAAATEVALTSYIPPSLSLETYSTSTPALVCGAGEHAEFGCTTASLGAGASVSVTLTLTRVAARETWVDAWTSSPAGDDNWDNNYGGLHLGPDRSNPADVEVLLSAPAQPEPGAEFVYSAAVINRGPERARSVTFNQSLADGVDFVSVTSSDPTDACSLHEHTYEDEGTDGGIEPYTYREVRCILGNMGFAEKTTLSVTVVRTDPHELWSSAWVETISYDGDHDNDWADASTAGHPSVTSDLVLGLDGPSQMPSVGDDFTYTATVTNGGPAPASDVVVDLWLPEQIAVRGIVSSREGDDCQVREASSVVCNFGNLALGDTAVVSIDVTRVGAREFWVGGSVYSTNYDPDYDTNYVEAQMDPDTSVPADLSLAMTGPEDPAVGSNFDYVMTVVNHGPQAATAVSLRSSLPDGTDFVAASSPDDGDVCSLFEETWDEEPMRSGDGGAAYTYRELRCDLGTLVPAETAEITLTLTRTADHQLWASAWVSTASYDHDFDNDWDGVGSFGDDTGGCGGASAESESGVIVCDKAGEGSGNYYSVTNEPGTKGLRAGKGNDSITMHVPTHAKKHRRIVVNGGKGRDRIRVTFAPGVGNVTVILKGGPGRDWIEVVAPRPGKRFKVRMWGGAGNDTCTATRGDRLRRRSC